MSYNSHYTDGREVGGGGGGVSHSAKKYFYFWCKLNLLQTAGVNVDAACNVVCHKPQPSAAYHKVS